jgi:acyl transferase domain-containing protein/glutamate-1-semialdehyde aminotransferase
MSYAEQYDPDEGIAIVGMAGRFPGAASVETLWQILRDGRETLTRFQPDELEPSFREDERDRGLPGYVPVRGVLDQADCFDEAFFGFSAAEAALLDPQQRVFLETAWTALENAGHDPARFAGPIGVFAGATANSYAANNLAGHPEWIDRLGLLTAQMANQGHYVATRAAFKLDLRGPALNIQTACSSSLVAVCTAVQSLQAYQCDMALAGGVSVTLPQRRGYRHQEGSILSPDGHCRAFDHRAAGTVFGHGVGLVVLRRLADARADGDTVYAVIKGAALNNDGHGKLSFTAPSVQGQAEVVAMAQALAGIDPQSIGYVEAHGTGTALGDPIEVAALTQAFRAGGDTRVGECGIGSLKTNIGHLDVAAGVAGLIKASLALQRRFIPASLHFESANPALLLETSPFRVQAQGAPWPASAHAPRRAAVSSFGVGGTNAHVVLEEAPADAASPAALPEERRAAQLLVVSARDAAALARGLQAWVSDGPWGPGPDGAPVPALADVAWTLQSGRHAFAHRAAWVAADHAQALEGARQALARAQAPQALDAARPDGPVLGVCAGDAPGVVFLFPGQGVDVWQAGRDLQRAPAVFADALEACVQALSPEVAGELREAWAAGPDMAEAARARLQQTALMQPALLAIELALAEGWMACGVRPAALIGHSLGEYAAACVAGTLARDDALRLVCHRAALMQAQPAGVMLAVRASPETLRPVLALGVDLAACNAPGSSVLSGPEDVMGSVCGQLDQMGLAWRRLSTSHAFHSAMMDPVAEAFEACVAAVPMQPPRLPWISGVTGREITAEEAVSPHYWARQLREPVRFSQAVASLPRDGQLWLELGPGDTLVRLVRLQTLAGPAPATAVSLPSQPPHPGLLPAVAQLWCAGVPMQWQALHRGPRRRVALPGYAFARNRHWIEPAATLPAAAQPTASVASLRAATTSGSEDLVPVPSFPKSSVFEASAPLPRAAAVDAAVATRSSSLPPPAAAALPDDTGLAVLAATLRELFGELVGLPASQVDERLHFLEMGLDSLSLTQAAQAVQQRLGVRLPMRVLLEDHTTVAALAAHLWPAVAPTLPPAVSATAATGTLQPPHSDTSAATAAPAAASQPAAAMLSAGALATGLHDGPAGLAGTSGEAVPWVDLLRQQVAITQRLLAAWGSPAGATAAPQAAASVVPAPATALVPALVPAPLAAAPTATSDAAPALSPPAAFGPYRPVQAQAPGTLDITQQAWLKSFVQRYTEATARSREWAQRHRPHLADPRSVAGYRQLWKDMVYPITTVRSSGAKLWDLDGRTYVDMVNGFGMILFGHNPAFVREAVAEQLAAGYEIGPQTPLAGEVAKALCDMVGMERAAFCGTGSEAVMAAIRMARTVTGRQRIVVFAGAYHGIFDEVLVRPAAAGAGRAAGRALPIAPGIPPSMLEQVTVLDYGDPAALRQIESLGPSLAAVLVEPVQSRRPSLQPRAFLQELRRITQAHGTALVFDEVVTGFRVHPGGAQAFFGIQADLATYGKVLGGGLPIGVVAGSARFLDALDGGSWRYEDDSAPDAGVTFFAGTFVRHPLALAAARAVLVELQRQGPDLQRLLNRRTSAFVQRLQSVAKGHGLPVEITHFASWFCFEWRDGWPWAPLFFGLLRLHGVHAWEGRPCFLTTAHSEADLDAVVAALDAACVALRAGGFGLMPAAAPETAAATEALPPVAGARRGRDREGREAWFVPDPERPGRYLQWLQGDTPHG